LTLRHISKNQNYSNLGTGIHILKIITISINYTDRCINPFCNRRGCGRNLRWSRYCHGLINNRSFLRCMHGYGLYLQHISNLKRLSVLIVKLGDYL